MTDTVLTNGNHDGTLDYPIKGPDQLFAEASPKPVKRAFENGLEFSSDIESPVFSPISTPLHDDLMGNIHIYMLWMRKFAKNKKDAENAWHQFRKDAMDQYDVFEKILKQIESEINVAGYSDEYLDMNSILQKKENIDAICAQICEYDMEFAKVAKIFERFAQYLPNSDTRKKVDSMMANLRVRYFNVLQELNKRKEIFRWIIPRLRRYKSSGSEIKTWLDSAESRSDGFVRNCNDMLSKQDIIEQIVEELNKNKTVYEDFLVAGKEIYSVEHQLQMDELQQDIEDVVQRWDLLVSNMERCLDRIEIEKKAVDIEKKSETEKIDIKIQDETHMCTCATPFKITKVGDGKYTFGTSKTIRLLRIHGQSIVVRVGGGWEYLYNFLLKVDPCRAKQLAATPTHRGIDAIHLSGISLTPMDKEDTSFRMSIKNVRKGSLGPPRRSNRGSFVSTPSADELDSCGDSFESLSLSESSSTSSVPPESRSESRSNSISRNSTERGNVFYGRKYSHTDSKLYRSSDNIHRKKSETPRISLMDRQTLYAKKRHSMVHSTSVLNL